MNNLKMMQFEQTKIEGVYIVKLSKHEDHRGWFARAYCENEFQNQGINFCIRQINHSFTKQRGSFRGVHYQFGKFSEHKLVKCISGSVIDFGVDLRKNSSTLFETVSVELTDSNNTMLLLPPGVGHGFQTLKDDTSLIYLHSSFYNKNYEGGFRYNDAKINLNLPLAISDISERDCKHPLINHNFLGVEYEV
jgi:dTDP-4-dehydrorhamnose 3,5-epimerase